VRKFKITKSEVNSLRSVVEFIDGDAPPEVWTNLKALYDRAQSACAGDEATS
jgi:hypothetical protein